MRRLALLLSILAALTAGCAQEGPDAPSARSPSVQTSGNPLTASVSMEANSYVPATVTIRPGGVVTWTNNEDVRPAPTHTASAPDGSWTTYRVEAGNAASHRFDAAGASPSRCNFHEGMSGTVVVE